MADIPLFENELYTKPYTTISRSGHFPIHYHRHIEFVYVVKGQTVVEVGKFKCLMSEGYAMFASPYETHSYAPLATGECILFKALMEPECLGLFGDILLNMRPVFPIITADRLKEHFPDIQNIISGLACGFGEKADKSEYIASFSALIHLLSGFLEISGIEPSDNSDNSTYIKAIRYCCDHYTDESLNIDTISEALHISSPRLKQLFKQNINMGVKEYINMLRMSKAETYLCESDINMIDIAFNCGYGTVRSFNRAFLKVHNQTPTEYRKEHQDNPSDNARKILSNFDLFYPASWLENNKK